MFNTVRYPYVSSFIHSHTHTTPTLSLTGGVLPPGTRRERASRGFEDTPRIACNSRELKISRRRDLGVCFSGYSQF